MPLLTDDHLLSVLVHLKNSDFLLNLYCQHDYIRHLAHARPNTLFSHTYIIAKMPSDRLLLATLAHSTCPEIDLTTLFIKAVQHNHLHTCTFLLNSGKVDPAANNNTPLLQAVHKGHTNIVKLLLDTNKVDPAANDNDPLRWAARNGYIEIVRLLIHTHKVNPAAENNEALTRAVIYGYTDIVKLLLDTGKVDFAANGNELLHRAHRYAHTSIVKLLYDAIPHSLVTKKTRASLTNFIQ
jgi:hypothetical protein